MNKEAKIIIDDICAHSVTFPSIPTTLISRKSWHSCKYPWLIFVV